MVIKVDKEGNEFLVKLADMALKGVGVAAMQLVNQLGAYMKPIEETPAEGQSARPKEMEVVSSKKESTKK